MTPKRLDPNVVEERLEHIRRLLDHLASKGEVTASRLEDDMDLRGSVLWSMTSVMNLATSINLHLCVALLDRRAISAAESYELLAEAGVLPEGLAGALVGATGMRNLLVHEYGEIDLAVVAAHVGATVERFGAYRDHVRTAVADHVARD